MTAPDAEHKPTAAVPDAPAPGVPGSAGTVPAGTVPSNTVPLNTVPSNTVPSNTVPSNTGPTAPAPAVRAVPAGEPALTEQSREDTDAAWGEYPDSAEERLHRDRPPHWDDF